MKCMFRWYLCYPMIPEDNLNKTMPQSRTNYENLSPFYNRKPMIHWQKMRSALSKFLLLQVVLLQMIEHLGNLANCLKRQLIVMFIKVKSECLYLQIGIKLFIFDDIITSHEGLGRGGGGGNMPISVFAHWSMINLNMI